jgi:hypothetical protein
MKKEPSWDYEKWNIIYALSYKLHVFNLYSKNDKERLNVKRFSRKTLSGSFLLPLVLSGLPVLFVIFVFICILVSNMISISDDVPEYLSLSTAFSGVRVAQSLISFCVMFCTSLFVLFLLTCFVSWCTRTTLYDTVYQSLATGRWFSPGTPISSTNKFDNQNITEILFKVALNTINLCLYFFFWLVLSPSSIYAFDYSFGTFKLFWYSIKHSSAYNSKSTRIAAI